MYELFAQVAKLDLDKVLASPYYLSMNSTTRLVIVILSLVGFVVSAALIQGYGQVRCHELGGNMMTGSSGLVECVSK